MSLYFSFKRFWINEEFSTPMNGNIMTSLSSTSTSMLSGAPSGSVPKKSVLLANFCWLGNVGKNNLFLEGKCCWEMDNSGCLRGLDVFNRCYVLFFSNLSPLLPCPLTEGVNFALCMTTPKLTSNVWTYVCWETSQ